MSEAAITSIVTGVVTCTITIVTFLTLWVKLKYGVDKAEEAATNAKVVEGKIDHNTVVTSEAKDAAKKASEHTETCDQDRSRILRMLQDHDARIKALESQMTAVKISIDSISKNLDSTRHEMRGHLQTLTNKVDLLAIASKKDQ